MSIATLDEISEGRAVLGLGTSGKLVVENFHGVPYKKPLTRLKDTIHIVRALLALPGQLVRARPAALHVRAQRLGLRGRQLPREQLVHPGGGAGRAAFHDLSSGWRRTSSARMVSDAR